jgi:hypothetical protein
MPERVDAQVLPNRPVRRKRIRRVRRGTFFPKSHVEIVEELERAYLRVAKEQNDVRLRERLSVDRGGFRLGRMLDLEAVEDIVHPSRNKGLALFDPRREQIHHAR